MEKPGRLQPEELEPENMNPNMENEPNSENVAVVANSTPIPDTKRKSELRKRKKSQSLKKRSSSSSEVDTNKKSLGRKRRSSVSKSKRLSKDISLKVAETWYLVLGLIVFIGLAYDMLGVSLKEGDTTFFGDWWDMIGTVAYIRGRNEVYHARKSNNVLSLGYISLVSFTLYRFSGVVCKSLMRQQLLLPSFPSYMDFMLLGFLPVHFFPGDYVYLLCEKNDRHQLLVNLAWGISKLKSLQRMNMEAQFVHNYSIFNAFALSLASCEMTSLFAKGEINLNLHSWRGASSKFVNGTKKWFNSTSLKCSILTSAFIVPAVRLTKSPIPLLWLPFEILAFCAIFYRYSNGLLEKVVLDNTREIMNNAQQKGELLLSRGLLTSHKALQQNIKDLTFALVYSARVLSSDTSSQITAFWDWCPKNEKELWDVFVPNTSAAAKETETDGSSTLAKDVLVFFGIVSSVFGTIAALLFPSVGVFLSVLVSLPYPVHATLKAWKDFDERTQWISYWSIFLGITALEIVLSSRRSSFVRSTFYIGMKLAFLYWCAVLRGAEKIWHSTNDLTNEMRDFVLDEHYEVRMDKLMKFEWIPSM